MLTPDFSPLWFTAGTAFGVAYLLLGLLSLLAAQVVAEGAVVKVVGRHPVREFLLWLVWPAALLAIAALHRWGGRRGALRG